MKDKDIHEEEVTEHDNGNIHKVVCDKNGCQQTFGVCEQIADFPIRRMIAFFYIIQIGRRKWEESDSDAEAKPERAGANLPE